MENDSCPDSTTKFIEGEEVLFHCDLIPNTLTLGKIEQIDWSARKCLVVYEELSAWIKFKDLKIWVTEPEDHFTRCILCKDYKIVENNTILTCDICLRTYHQRCHEPVIDIIDQSWICTKCSNKQNCHLIENTEIQKTVILPSKDDILPSEPDETINNYKYNQKSITLNPISPELITEKTNKLPVCRKNVAPIILPEDDEEIDNDLIKQNTKKCSPVREHKIDRGGENILLDHGDDGTNDDDGDIQQNEEVICTTQRPDNNEEEQQQQQQDDDDVNVEEQQQQQVDNVNLEKQQQLQEDDDVNLEEEEQQQQLQEDNNEERQQKQDGDNEEQEEISPDTKMKALLRSAQKEDAVCRTVEYFILNGWPTMAHFADSYPRELTPWWWLKDELTLRDGLVCVGRRIVVPAEGGCRRWYLDEIRAYHAVGLDGSVRRIRNEVFWPGISSDVDDILSSCEICRSASRGAAIDEETVATYVAEEPWLKAGISVFEVRNMKYVLVVDYFSKYADLCKVDKLCVASLIDKAKLYFSRFGIPMYLNVYLPLSSSTIEDASEFERFPTEEWLEFEKSYGLRTSIRRSSHSSEDETIRNAIEQLKSVLESDRLVDPYLAVLRLRSTPNETGLSPGEIFMRRKFRSVQVPEERDESVAAVIEEQANDNAALTETINQPFVAVANTGNEVQKSKIPVRTITQNSKKAILATGETVVQSSVTVDASNEAQKCKRRRRTVTQSSEKMTPGEIVGQSSVHVNTSNEAEKCKGRGVTRARGSEKVAPPAGKTVVQSSVIVNTGNEAQKCKGRRTMTHNVEKVASETVLQSFVIANTGKARRSGGTRSENREKAASATRNFEELKSEMIFRTFVISKTGKARRSKKLQRMRTVNGEKAASATRKTVSQSCATINTGNEEAQKCKNSKSAMTDDVHKAVSASGETIVQSGTLINTGGEAQEYKNLKRKMTHNVEREVSATGETDGRSFVIMNTGNKVENCKRIKRMITEKGEKAALAARGTVRQSPVNVNTGKEVPERANFRVVMTAQSAEKAASKTKENVSESSAIANTGNDVQKMKILQRIMMVQDLKRMESAVKENTRKSYSIASTDQGVEKSTNFEMTTNQNGEKAACQTSAMVNTNVEVQKCEMLRKMTENDMVKKNLSVQC